MDKWFNSKWFVRGVSLAFAILLYVFVFFETTSIQSNQSRVPSATNAVQVLEQVPVDIRMDSDKYVVSGVPDHVTVTLEGPNSVLIPAARQQNFTVFVDLTDLEEGNHEVDIEYEKLPDDLNIYIEPKTISIGIEERASAEFPVELEYINIEELPFGYELGDITIDPETITVTSSRSLIDQIAIVKVFVDVEGLTESINKREVPVNVYDSQGNGLDIRTEPERVVISVNIDNPSKEVNVTVETINELPEGLEIENMTVDRETVEVFASSDLLEELDEVQTEPIDLSEITSSGPVTVKLATPEDVSIEGEEVTVTLELTQTKIFEDLDINIENLGEEELVDLSDEASTNILTIIGDESIVKELTEEDFNLYIDVEGLGVGEHLVPILIDGPEDVLDDLETELENEEITIIIS